MLTWHEMSIVSRVLLVLTSIAFALVLFVVPEGFEFSWVAVPLFLATFVYHHIDHLRARKRLERERETAKKKDPRLDGDPPDMKAGTLPADKRFALIDLDTGDELATIEERDLTELIRKHEEWGLELNDFLIMEETVQVLKDDGASRSLVELLNTALNGRDSMEVRWVED